MKSRKMIEVKENRNYYYSVYDGGKVVITEASLSDAPIINPGPILFIKSFVFVKSITLKIQKK